MALDALPLILCIQMMQDAVHVVFPWNTSLFSLIPAPHHLHGYCKSYRFSLHSIKSTGMSSREHLGFLAPAGVDHVHLSFCRGFQQTENSVRFIGGLRLGI